MKWILLLAIIVIIQYEEVAGYPSKMINNTSIEHTPADRNKTNSWESNCEYCQLKDNIRAVYEAIRKERPINIFRYSFKSLFGKSIEDIFLPRSARSPRMEWMQYLELASSFDDTLFTIKEKLNSLESQYNFVNEFLQEAEVNREKIHQTGQISFTEKSSKYKVYFGLLSDPSLAESIMDHWIEEFDNDIDFIKDNFGFLKNYYARVINNLENIKETRIKVQISNIFLHHWSLFDELIKDMIRFCSTRSTYVINSFNDAVHVIKITLDNLERNYNYINELLQKVEEEEKREQTDQIAIKETTKFISWIPWSMEFSLLPRLNKWFDNDIADIENTLGLLKIKYKLVIDQLKQIAADVREANSEEDKKDPSPSESIVSNNNTQENVTQTIPTPDKSTNTQKPVPTKHNDKLVGEKDPLHTSEIAPNNKTPINVIIPTESTIIEKLELTTIKNEEKPEQFKEIEKDTFSYY